MSHDLNPHSKRLLDELVENAQKHGLVLFVGSGVNAGAAFQWGELITRLLRKALREVTLQDDRIAQFCGRYDDEKWINGPMENWCLGNFEVCAIASLAKSILGAARFQMEIQQAIYGKTGDVHRFLHDYCKDPQHPPKGLEDHKRFAFLHGVAELSSLPQVRAVATFNYDDFLETAIRAKGVKTPVSYCGNVDSMPLTIDPGQQIFPVFHVHGLLSPPDSPFRNSGDSAVLAYDEYFAKNADPLSWETSTPIHLLRNFCTLWLGASLKDWNMLRLLNAAKTTGTSPPSYCILCLKEVRQDLAYPSPSPALSPDEPAFRSNCSKSYHDWDSSSPEFLKFQHVAMRIQATLFEQVGAELIIAGADFADIPAVLQDQLASRLRGANQYKLVRKST